MKKFFYGMMAATMMFASSCQNELEVGAVGEESVVSFTISTPDMGSRAYSDGFTATQLQYAVYEGETELRDLTVMDATINGSTTVELKLATGKTYNVIFWAADEDAPYTFTPADGKVSVNYGSAISNNENLDAFYAVKEITVKGAQTETIELRRPFAQLNIGTSDYDEAKSAGYEPTLSKVVVSNVYQSINLWNGTVSDGAEVTFDYNAIDKDETFPVLGYEYLAMNYLLVDNRKELVEVTFSYKEESGEEQTRKVGSVPVQRNYRTNIYGQLLTSDVDVNVEIKPEYVEPDNEISTVVFSNVELQAALDAATTGTTTIYLGKDIEGDVVDFQKADRNIVIEGGNNKYNGTIKIHTGSNYNNGTITIKNVAFETSKASLNFIMPNEVGTGLRYPNNVTVEKCTFTATGAAENTAVGVQAKAVRNLQIIECTATGLHSLLQAQSCDTDDVIVKDCTITGKNGVAFKQVKNALVENTTITAAAYGIRFDGNIDNYSISAKDINVTAVQPFIVRKMTGANNTIKLEGNNTLTASAGGYQIVITNGSDDEAYIAPTGSYSLTGANDFLVYPTANQAAVELVAAINDPTQTEIELTEKVENVGQAFDVTRDIVFNMNGQELNAGSTANSTNYAIEAYGDINVVFNDANFTRAGIYAGSGADIEFNSGIINHKPERSSRYIFCAQSGSTITINGGTFNNDRTNNAYFWADNATIYVKGGNFGGVASKNKVVLTSGGQLIISGGTFNFDPTAWLANGYVATKNGSTWTVSAI